jgi:hypothetical protein
LILAAEEEQDMRFQQDPWDRPVWDYLVGARSAHTQGGKPEETFTITMDEILEKALQKIKKDWTRQDSNRVCAIMRKRGLEYKRERVYDANGDPVIGPRGKQLREYHFCFPLGNGRPQG